MAKPFAWSFSRLTAFEGCSHKYNEVTLEKNWEESFGGAASAGQDAHRAFEHYVGKGDPLPIDLIHHQKFLNGLLRIPGDPLVEQRMALTRSLDPTGFFDNDVWCRAIADFICISTNKDGKKVAVIIDYKFGKRKDDFDQLMLCAAVLAQIYPDIERFSCSFYWAKEKQTASKVWSRQDVTASWDEWRRRAAAMEQAIIKRRFTKKPTGLCRKHCVVRSCEHNGNYIGGTKRDAG